MIMKAHVRALDTRTKFFVQAPPFKIKLCSLRDQCGFRVSAMVMNCHFSTMDNITHSMAPLVSLSTKLPSSCRVSVSTNVNGMASDLVEHLALIHEDLGHFKICG